MTHLVPCSACSRHVRVSESACPFCGAELPASLRERAAPKGPAARLTRAALLAFGALGGGTLAATPGCSSSSPSPGGGTPFDASAPDAGDDGGIVVAPPYGAFPPFPDDASDDAARVVAAYGLPAFIDSGASGDAATDAEAKDANTGIGIALYGSPPLQIDDGGTH